MPKFTKGPWMYSPSQETVVSAEGRIVVYEMGTNEADGHLIAAAIQMYVALSLLVDDDECMYDHHGYCQTHNLGNPCAVALGLAALAKAEGKTP